MEGKKKETELAELENFFDNIDINQNEKCNTNNIRMLYERNTIKSTIGNHFFKGTAKIKRRSFQGQNFMSPETVRGIFTFVIIEA